MRKLVLILVIAAAAAGGYTLYWHKKADEFKQKTEQSVAALNSYGKTLDPAITMLRYSSAEVTGFPFSMQVVLVKPIIDVPMNQLLEKIREASKVGNQPPAAPPFKWVEEVSYGGNLTLAGNIWGNSFTFTAQGDRTHKSLINGAVRHSLLGTTSSPLVCHLSVADKGAAPWTLSPAFDNAQDFIRGLRSVDCSGEGMTIKDTATNAVLFTVDAVDAQFTSTPEAPKQHKFSFALHQKNAKGTQAAEALIGDYLLMTYTIMGTPEAQHMPTPPISAYGDQNMAIELSYDGPLDQQSFESPDLHVDLDIKKFDISNALFNFSYTGHMSSEPQADNRITIIALHGTSEATAAYDQLAVNQFASFFSRMLQSDQTPADASVTKTFAQLGAPSDVATAVVPQFHSFGKTALDIDMTLTAPNNLRSVLAQMALNIGALNWVAAPYGIKINGNSNYSQGKAPTADVTATCLNCDALITDLGNYAMRIEALSLRVSPHTPYVTTPFVEGVRQFIHGISENASAKDLAVHFVMKDGQFTISKRQLPELLTLFATTIAPNLPAPQPASNSPPSAPTESPAR